MCVNMNIMCASSLLLLEGGLRTPVHKATGHVNASNSLLLSGRPARAFHG